MTSQNLLKRERGKTIIEWSKTLNERDFESEKRFACPESVVCSCDRQMTSQNLPRGKKRGETIMEWSKTLNERDLESEKRFCLPGVRVSA
ncbi:hypothetical protein CEXT_478311 [Caerostris extrusa]|uniref:Uncharacterized protein n=1 Tax=Caerostris extrusa TaxID=172846 RepID=A0AAV4UIU6_CAEEX|nr:hypothetical protein CEXT_478311 [Caerostris extrusa]